MRYAVAAALLLLSTPALARESAYPIIVKGASVHVGGGTTTVRIETNRSVDDEYAVFRLTSPMRVVIDFPVSTLEKSFDLPGSGAVKKYRASHVLENRLGQTRVEIELDGNHLYEVKEVKNALEVRIQGDGPAATPTPPPGLPPLSIQRIRVSDRTRDTVVRIDTDGSPASRYRIFRLTDPMQLVVELPESSTPAELAEITVENGVVRSVVTDYRVDASGRLGRVVIHLEKPAEYTVAERPDGLDITLEKP